MKIPNMKKLIFHFVFALFIAGQLSAQAYRIEVELDNFSSEELYLGFYYGDKQYLKDTAVINQNGSFVFEGDEALPGGVYLLVMPPGNQFVQLLVNPDNQSFKLKTDSLATMEKMEVEGSEDNELFYTYMNYLGSKRPEAEKLQLQISEAGDDENKKTKLEEQLKKLNEEVEAFQRKLVTDHPKTLTAALIKANFPVDMPEFKGTSEEIQEKKWRHMQKHYFDKIDLTDPRMLRTPFLYQRIDYYINNLTVQHPDTIAKAIDHVLAKLKPSEETFKYYLIHFLNAYAKSKVVGFDAVYVHIVDNYYAKGMAPWTEKEQLDKIIDNANTLKPLLIGKIAPDIQLQKRDGSKISLHEVDKPYTVLYFWRYDCGHCKKSTPDMKAFYEKFRDRGVELMAVCVKFTKDIPDCWKYVDENEINDWLHTVDPYLRSKFTTIYDIKTTPQIYILDENKEIISKKIGAEQLEEVMDKIIEMNKSEKAGSSE